MEDLLITTDLKNGKVEIYNHRQQTWDLSRRLLKMPIKRKIYYQQVLLGNWLYAFGIFFDKYQNPTNKTWRRNINTDHRPYWTPKAAMQQNRKNFSTVVLNDTIYVFGGLDLDNNYLNSVERYDSQLNEWSTVADMNIARACASAAVINGCIYVAGGRSVQKKRIRTLDSVEKYDPNTNRWKRVEEMPTKMHTPRYHFALTPFAGRLWAIGGSNSGAYLSACESYDPDENTWRNERQLEVGRKQHAAVEYYGELYVVGGTNNNVENYAPLRDNWIRDSNVASNNFYSTLLIIPYRFLAYFRLQN